MFHETKFMRKIAVIPARGGSTRLKNKNIIPIKGKPLVRWSTEAVINSGCFDSVVISTDSDEIFEAVSDLQVLRHIRPAEHATVKATALDAMLDIIDSGDNLAYDIFSYFLPTCPLISPEDIQRGVRMLRDEDVDSVISMTQIPETIQLACVMKDGWVLPIFDNLECGLTNSKFIKKYYKPSGAFYMSRWNNLKRARNFFKGNVKGVIIPPERSVDINTIGDVKYMESLL